MVNRPSFQHVKARKAEIARRYRWQRAETRKKNRSRSMAAIRLAELTRLLDDTYGQGVELEQSDASYGLVRIVAHHFGGLRDTPRRISTWIETYAPWLGIRSRERLIGEVVHCPLKWSADKLAWKLKLTDATRTRLKIRTIGAIDCNREQRLARSKAKRAERDAIRRPRKPEPAAKPWLSQNISRRTWYRRGKPD